MTKEQLQAKVDLYTAKKAEIEAKDYSAEIEAELAAYKAELVAKHEVERKADLDKVEHYLEFAAILVKEAEEEEAKAAEVADEAVSTGTPFIG